MQMGSGKNKQWDKSKSWDSVVPDDAYFKELFRVSKNQIIWGGNYFPLPLIRSWIIWDKGIYGDCSFADCEMGWNSFDRVARIAQVRYKGFLGADINRIHPTQKPVALYKWLLQNYAKQGDKILDTHLGSGSIAIACHQMGFDLTGSELDKDYFEAMQKRIKEETAQKDLFEGII
jgi:site-specific DNA-methyltransferase (adenine-specific)